MALPRTTHTGLDPGVQNEHILEKMQHLAPSLKDFCTVVRMEMQLSWTFSRFTKVKMVKSTELKGGKACKLEHKGETLRWDCRILLHTTMCSVTIISFHSTWKRLVLTGSYRYASNNSTRSSDQRGTTCQHTPWFFLRLLWSSVNSDKQCNFSLSRFIS